LGKFLRDHRESDFMNWKKLGRIFNVHDRSAWMHAYAYVPTAILLDERRVRIFLAFRDRENVGRIGSVDVSAQDPTQILSVAGRPCLDIGQPGCFDDNGVTPLSIVRDGDVLRLYYMGWQLTPRARYLLFTGLAISRDGGDTFERSQLTPILDRSPTERIVRSGAHVMKDGDHWKIWYAAGSGFVDIGGKRVPTYHLAYAESPDGVSWPSQGRIAIRPREPDEYGFGRPCVVKDGELYRIWYSTRSHSQDYLIGYATSSDGINWDRDDRGGGLPKSRRGWDSEMTCFASVVDTKTGRYMFYNGNGFGQTGVGVARLEN
jgi:hypothetical protein